MRTIQSTTMMRMAAIALLLFAASACKKDDPAPAPTKEQLLTTAKGWTMTGTTIVIEGQTASTDVFNQRKDCEKDDVTTFNADGTYVYNDGAVKCGAGQPSSATVTWAFNSDKTQLTRTVKNGTDTSTITFSVIELTASTLKLISVTSIMLNIASLNYPKGIVTLTFTPVK